MNFNFNVTGNDSFVNTTNKFPGFIVGFVGYRFCCHVLNTIGNIVIVTLIYKDCKVKTGTAKLFVNQAVADGAIGLLLSIFSIVVLFLRINGQDASVDVVLKTVRVCLVVFYSESFQTLGAIAFTLHVAICHPVKYRIYKSEWNAFTYIVATWLINMGIGCLIFVAQDSLNSDGSVLFSFNRDKPKDIWYEVLKMAAMFLAPLLGVVCFVKMLIQKRTAIQDDVAAQSSTKQLVRTSVGVTCLSTMYSLAFILLIVGESTAPIDVNDHSSFRLAFLHSIVYQYLVFKLPLFLLFFKAYRKHARRMLCPCFPVNQVGPQN